MIARADQLHALASGNKIYKLKLLIDFAKAQSINKVVSFGGAFSNHIHALALMGQAHGLETIGFIRGEPQYAQNPTLSDAQKAGMQLQFIDRRTYQKRNDPDFLATLQDKYPQALIVAEGGSSQWAIAGCQQLTNDINAAHFSDILAVASGTGVTAAGMVCGLAAQQQLRIYHVLKETGVEARIAEFIQNKKVDKQYSVHTADFGGYAKLDESHLNFILQCLEQTGVLLDPIYTSKMCRALVRDIEHNCFKADQTITFVHSGGLQGWRGMQKRVELLAGQSTWQRINDALLEQS